MVVVVEAVVKDDKELELVGEGDDGGGWKGVLFRRSSFLIIGGELP